MAQRQLVLAIFANEAAADDAVVALKDWDKLDDQVKLDSIGVLVLDDKGKVKQHKLGRHNTGKGAGIGFVLGLLGLGLGPILGIGLVGWVIGGAIIGRLVHKSLGMTKDDLTRIAGELQGGKAAVGVLVEEAEAPSVTEKLGDLGGDAETHPVEEDELTTAAAADAEAAAAAAPESVADVSGEEKTAVTA